MNIQRIDTVPGGSDPKRRPYGLGVVAEGKFLFISGHGPWDPEQQKMVGGPIEEQTTRTLQCLERVAKEAGADIRNVVSVRVYLQQLTETNFAAMNRAFEAFFGPHRPARTTIGAQLINIDVEIDCVVAM